MTRSTFIRRSAVAVLALTAVSAWAFLAATFLLDLERSWRVAAVVAAVIASEALVWGGAALLGWKAFENRKAIWRRLTGGAA
ncbi:MAG: hypothetical protein ACOC20_03625 [Oceanicaulis sp.]